MLFLNNFSIRNIGNLRKFNREPGANTIRMHIHKKNTHLQTEQLRKEKHNVWLVPVQCEIIVGSFLQP